MSQDTASDTDAADPNAIEGPAQTYIFSAEEEAKLVGEDETYREYHRVRKARASRVLKDELTRKIDHILYTEWDPIGVHLLGEFDCFDEYHSYLPGIVGMLREDASLSELSDQLMEVESYMLGPDTIRRRCDVIAVMITQYGPHAARHPFVVTINTDTREAAYQSVLDLLTQTRLDAYENRWAAVCRGYEKAVEICRAFLPRRDILLGACLNNLGHAYTMAGQLDKALAALEQAAPRLKPKQCRGRLTDRETLDLRLYAPCLENLVAHLAHRGERLAAVRYARALVAYSARSHGKNTGQTWEARERLDRLILRKDAPETLRCARIPVEQDGCGGIQYAVLID
jgi:tetratricopeptide (TPR) repeat protein